VVSNSGGMYNNTLMLTPNSIYNVTLAASGTVTAYLSQISVAAIADPQLTIPASDPSASSYSIAYSPGLLSTTGVPEPSTWAMMLIGFAGLGFAFRRSRRKVSFAWINKRLATCSGL
jgi:PEP-CTERM motif